MIETYSWPYFESGEVGGYRGAYPITVDGVGYMTDTSNNTPYNETWHRTSIDLLQSVPNPDDNAISILPPEVWRRSISSWHHGAGQTQGDSKVSDQYRFHSSRGVNVWDKYKASLLNDTEVVQAGEGAVKGVVVNNVAVVAIGTSVYIVRDNPTNAADIWSGVSVTPGVYTLTSTLSDDPVDVATDGRYAFFLVDDYIYRVSPTYGTTTITSVQLPDSLSPSMIEFVNGHMVVGVDTDGSSNGILYNVSPVTADMVVGDWTASAYKIGETVTPVYWKGACSGKAAMFFLGGINDNYGVYSVTITQGADAVELSAPARVADLPVGEVALSIYSYLGYVMIGTSQGIRFAAAEDQNLVYGPLIDIDRPVTCFEGYDRFVWFGWSDFENASGTGRLDMSEFVFDLQPSYATDVMTDLDDGLVDWIGIIQGRVLFAVDSTIYRQTDDLVTSGWIKTSDWSFGVIDRKVGFYATVVTEPLDGELSTEVTFDSSTLLLGSSALPGSVSHKFNLNGQSFSLINVKVTLTSSNNEGPVLRSIDSRSTYIRGSASEWRIPVLVRDALELPMGQVESRNVTSDYQHLVGLYESGRPFVYSEGEMSWDVFATGYLWSPTELSEVRDGWQGVLTLVCREVR